MKKIVLTGGPCAGKTTVLEILKEKFLGQILIVPEVATTLLVSFPVPGKDIEWTADWQETFQTAVAGTQIQLEHAYEIKASQDGLSILICDRGLLDGAAYTPGGLEEFSHRYNIKIDEALKRYEAVIHLESLAVSESGFYGDHNNSLRFESLEEAVKLEQAVRKAWSGHSNHIFISCVNGLEGKILETKEIVKKLLETLM